MVVTYCSICQYLSSDTDHSSYFSECSLTSGQHIKGHFWDESQVFSGYQMNWQPNSQVTATYSCHKHLLWTVHTYMQMIV